MILKLQEYDFDLYYTPGKDNVVDTITKPPISNVLKEQPQRKKKASKRNVQLDTAVQGIINAMIEISSN